MQSYRIDFSEFVSYKHTPLCFKAHTWYCVRLWFIQFQLCTYSPSCNCTQIYLSIVLMDICIIPSIRLCIVYIPIHSFMLARSILLCFQCTCAGFSRSGTAALYACLLCFPRQCQTVFQNGYTNIHSHYNWRKFLWLHILIILGIWLLTFLPIWRLRKKIILEY